MAFGSLSIHVEEVEPSIITWLVDGWGVIATEAHRPLYISNTSRRRLGCYNLGGRNSLPILLT